MISLEILCLNVIVAEFERFYFAYKESKDETIKLNSKFLQIKYSSEVASHLFKEEKLKREYVDFFLNKCLTFLDGDWWRISSYPNFINDIIPHLPKLHTIVLHKHCTDENLANIAKFCPEIVEIHLTSSPVTDNGIKYLCKDEKGKIPCPKLTRLFIRGSRITEEGIEHLLQNLPTLEILQSVKVPQALYSLHKEDLQEIEKSRNYNLLRLELSCSQRPYYTDLLKICLNVCPRLKSLTCFILNEEQLSLFNNTSLEHVKLRFENQGSKVNINNFLKINRHNLASLDLFHCTMSVSRLAESCPNLMQLWVDDVTFENEDDHLQLVFSNLVECIFRNVEDDSSNKKAVRFLMFSSAKLERVSFEWIYPYMSLSLDMKMNILKCCKNQQLKEITFYGPTIEMNFVKDILYYSPSLMKFNLMFYNLDDEYENELKKFAKMLPNKPHIYCRDLYYRDGPCFNEESCDYSRLSTESLKTLLSKFSLLNI